MLDTLLGVGVTLITLFVNALIERFKSRFEMQQKEYQSKREHLTEVYKELIAIVNLYPCSSPNDILSQFEGAPNYLMESFDAILKTLDYQIEEEKKQLNSQKQKQGINEEISNKEFAKEEIAKVRDEYYIAKEKYALFCESDKVILDLYAGQDVRNCLVDFEVTIHNVYISGRKAGDKYDPVNNEIQKVRRNLVNSMRRDIGIS